MSSFLHTNMCSCGPYLLKIVITTIWQWIFSTILLRKLLSFLGLTMSPGNLSPLSGPCFVKYCFKKHSPGLFFSWYVPGKELICRWFKQCIRSQSSALLLPCANCFPCHKDLWPVLPWLCMHLVCKLVRNSRWYLTTDIGKILCLWVRGMCQIPLLWNKCVSASRRWGENCCFQLQDSSVLLQWFAPGSGSHSYFCNCNSQKFFLKIKAIISRAWFMVGGLSMAAEFGKQSLWVCSRAGCAPRAAHTTQDYCCSAFSSETFLLNTLCHTLLCTPPVRWILHPCVLLGQSFL